MNVVGVEFNEDRRSDAAVVLDVLNFINQMNGLRDDVADAIERLWVDSGAGGSELKFKLGMEDNFIESVDTLVTFVMGLLQTFEMISTTTGRLIRPRR